MKLKNLVKLELPHIKKVIDDLHCQGLSSGALPEIYNNLFGAVYGNAKDAPLTSRQSRATGTEAESNDEGYKELFNILAQGRNKLPPPV